MRRVIIESPFAGKTAADIEANLVYVRRAMADCIARTEAPYASHALYTQPGVLDDAKPEERALGIEAGFVWGDVAHAVVFYLDRGWSNGMRLGLERAKRRGVAIEHRYLDSVVCWDCLGVGEFCGLACSVCKGRGCLPKPSRK